MQTEYYIVLALLFVLFLLRDKKGKRKDTNTGEQLVSEKPQVSGNQILIDFILNENIDGVISILSQGKAGPHAMAGNGQSALELAIAKDNKFLVAYLIKFGAFPNQKERQLALKKGNFEIIEMVKTGHHLKVISEYEMKYKR